jgi:hypothetical protein
LVTPHSLRIEKREEISRKVKHGFLICNASINFTALIKVLEL